MANYNKYQKLMLFERVKGTTSWYPSVSPEGEPTYKKGEIIEVDSPDCGAPAEPVYRWYVIPNSYMCDEELHIKYQEKVYQVSTDGGLTWTDVQGVEHERGEIIERDSIDCGAIVIVYQWVNVAGEYLCNGTDKYYVQKQQISYNNGRTWEDVVPEQRRRGDIMETQASDCGYEGDWIYRGNFICIGEEPPTPPEPVDEGCFTYQPDYLTSTFKVNMVNTNFNGTGTQCVDPITDATSMFNNCNTLIEVDLSNIDFDENSSFYQMFSYCSILESVKFGPTNISPNMSFGRMFCMCTSLVNIDLSNFTVSTTANTYQMFYGCNKLETINLTGWSLRKPTGSSNNMFKYCTSLREIIATGCSQETYSYLREELAEAGLSGQVDILTD